MPFLLETSFVLVFSIIEDEDDLFFFVFTLNHQIQLPSNTAEDDGDHVFSFSHAREEKIVH